MQYIVHQFHIAQVLLIFQKLHQLLQDIAVTNLTSDAFPAANLLQREDCLRDDL